MLEFSALNYDGLRFWWQVFLALCSVVAAAYTWHVSRSRATKKGVEEIRALVAALRCEQDRLQMEVNHLPTHADIGSVYGRLSAMEMRLSELVGSVAGMTRGLDNINTYLLNKER